jgi:hypothetical protein
VLGVDGTKRNIDLIGKLRQQRDVLNVKAWEIVNFCRNDPS